MKRYLEATFRGKGKPYLYHFDGTDLPTVGDPVIVTTRHGGVTTLTVSAIHPPDFSPPADLSVTTQVFKA